MAPKNLNLPPPLTTGTADTSHGGAPPIQEQSYTESVKLDCERALLPLHRNNHAEALRLIEETCLCHPNSAIAHRTQAHINHQAASQITDPAAKQQHLQNAVVSARRAVTLSPSSIEHVDFLCGLLFEFASDARVHEEVVRECERALAVEDPIDPVNDTTVEERIESVFVELRSHMQKSMAAFSEKVGEINVPKVKEISVQLSSESKESEKSSSSSIVPKEKQTNVPRNAANLEQDNLKNIELSLMKINQSREYWETMSEEKRRGFLELKIGDLRKYFRSLKDDSAVKTFLEAVDYADKNKTWKFWPCYLCDEKFAKVESRLKHIEKFHKKAIARDLRDYVPQEIDPDWSKLLVHGIWKPVDIPRAMEIIQKQSKSELGNEDKYQFSCEVPKKEDEVSEDKDLDDINKLKKISLPKACFDDIKKLKKISLPKACSDNQNWPLSDDIKRAKTLESIHGEFQLLVRREYLSMKNLSKVIGYAIEQLQKFVPASELRIHGLDQTPLCICFLGLFQLNSVLNFLKHLSSVGNIHMVPHTGSFLSDFQEFEFKERIVFTGDPSYVLDEQFLKVEFIPHKNIDAAATCKICDDEVDVVPDGDALMHYLFAPSATIEKLLAIWRVVQDGIQRRGLSSLETLEKEFIAFQGLYKLDKTDEKLEKVGLEMWTLGAQHKKTTSLDYRSIMVSLLKLFMKAQMEALVDEDARQKADAAQIAILSELELNAKKNTSKGGSPTKHPKEESMAKMKNKDKKKAKDPKANRGDELNVVQEDREEEPHFPSDQTVGSPSSVIDELKQQEEEERKLKEMLERQRLIEDEAKQKNLAKKTTNEANYSVIRLNLEPSGSVMRLKLEASGSVIAEFYVEKMQLNLEASGSVMAHQDPSLGKSKMPEDFSGVPVSTKSPKDSSRASASRKNGRSCSHSKVKQDTIPAQKNLPLTMSQSEPSEALLEKKEGVLLDILGPGMKNDAGEFNCFLNVIVQSLWHLRKFKDKFSSRSTSAHVHIGHPCVICALHEVLNDLSLASANMHSEAVSPAPLRIALSQLKSGSNLFQLGQQNDASEVLIAILDCLHQSFTPGSGVSDAEPLGSRKCGSDACIAHRLFEVDIVIKLICQYCGTESRQHKYNSYSYIFNAGALRSAKTSHAGIPFDELFKLDRNKESLTCDPEVKGCGKDNHLNHILSIRPHVFTLVLGWGTPTESIDDISETLEVLSTDIDLGVVFDGLDPGHIHSLISMVCYGGRHYICFVYSCEHEEWIMYNDAIVEVIGSWDNVTLECGIRKLQPTVLFFESVE